MAFMKHFLEKTGTVAVDGGKINYRYYLPITPSFVNRIPLITVHGGPGDSGMTWYDSIYPLADERPVLFYDQLGSYYSPAAITEDQMKLDRFADELNHILAEIGASKAYLLGQSWGSAVATQFTLEHPDKVAGLILSGPHLSTPRWVADCNRLLDQLPADIQKIIKDCETNGTTNSDEYKAADDFFSKRHFIRITPPPPNQKFHKDHNRFNSIIYNAMWGPSEFTCTGSLHDMDLFPRLHEIKIPVLLICGEYDTSTPETVRDAASQISSAHVEVIPNSGHLSYVDNQDLYINLVNTYLQKQDATTPTKDT